MSKPIQQQARNKDTSQYIDNDSYDPNYKVKAVEVLVENETEDALLRQKPIATEAKQDILARYRISDIDDPYYGYLDKDGNWYIMKMDGISARYSRGDSDYATNWANRLSLTYDYFDAIF